jgi:hypothetical protein
MRFAFLVEQDVPWFDVTMQDPVLVRILNGPRYLGDQFHRAPDRHRFARDYFVELTAFDKFHAEVTRAVALPHLVNWNNSGMIQTRSGFGFPSKALQMRVSSPTPQANDLERYCPVETFLPRDRPHPGRRDRLPPAIRSRQSRRTPLVDPVPF